MNSRKSGEEGTQFFKRLYRDIDKEMRGKGQSLSAIKNRDRRAWREMRAALLQDILQDIDQARAERKAMKRLLEENLQTQEICVNPGLKKYYEIKAKLMRVLLIGALGTALIRENS